MKAKGGTMDELQIRRFVTRLNSGYIKPGELRKLTDGECEEVLIYLQEREEIFLYRYMNHLLANRNKLTGNSPGQNYTYSESEILNELGMDEQL